MSAMKNLMEDISMYFDDGYSVEEIIEMTGVPEKYVKQAITVHIMNCIVDELLSLSN